MRLPFISEIIWTTLCQHNISNENILFFFLALHHWCYMDSSMNYELSSSSSEWIYFSSAWWRMLILFYFKILVKESDSDTVIMVIFLVLGVGGIFILFAIMALCYRFVKTLLSSKIIKKCESVLKLGKTFQFSFKHVWCNKNNFKF